MGSGLRFQVEKDGFEVGMDFEIEASIRSAIGMAESLIEELKKAGFRQVVRKGGRGSGPTVVTDWARAVGLRAFCFEKEGQKRGVIAWKLEPAEGSFESREAVMWEPDGQMERIPAALSAAIRASWESGDKRGKEFSLSTVELSVGFAADGDRLKALEVRSEKAQVKSEKEEAGVNAEAQRAQRAAADF